MYILATSSGYYDVVVLLLKAGANPNLKDKRGRTPFILGNHWESFNENFYLSI